MTLPKNLPPHVLEVLTKAIEITLPSPENFLKVKETLSRIGIASQRDKTLYQSCHILHKQGQYFIIHFKEAFLLDGKLAQTNFDDGDIARRNSIATMLANWGLVDIVHPDRLTVFATPGQITVLPFKEKTNWTLVSKYEIGRKR